MHCTAPVFGNGRGQCPKRNSHRYILALPLKTRLPQLRDSESQSQISYPSDWPKKPGVTTQEFWQESKNLETPPETLWRTSNGSSPQSYVADLESQIGG